jgi:hypothetical protein
MHAQPRQRRRDSFDELHDRKENTKPTLMARKASGALKSSNVRFEGRRFWRSVS